MPFPPYKSVLANPADQDLVQQYQFAAFAKDVAAHRDGARPSRALLQLMTLCQTAEGVAPYHVYRGVRDFDSPQVGARRSDRSVSSWTLRQHVALNIAMAQPRGNIWIMRYKVPTGEPGLYLDGWEDEVLRPPYSSTISGYRAGQLRLGASQYALYVVDLE